MPNEQTHQAEHIVREYLTEESTTAIPIVPLSRGFIKEWLAGESADVAAWVEASGFTAEAGHICLLPGANGRLDRVLFGRDEDDPWTWAHLPAKLPKGVYRIATALDAADADWAAVGWSLACYQFIRYQSRKGRDWPTLVWPAAARRDQVVLTVEAQCLVRDLVNTPSADMGPEELAGAASALALRTGGQIRTIVGDDLLQEGYPAIHAVGRASTRAPRLIDLKWGDENAPKVTLVGKGVCFDSGGLDLKGASNMKLMKKDMGGAAHVLALASMIVAAKIPVRLRVLIPAVENSVSGNAFRPLDVLSTRKGLTVEVGNTDAEGRLILADALAEGDREKPDLLIDLATLTGAARTALGPDLPAMFSPNDELATDILAAADDAKDPIWRLPLWKNYRRLLDSKIADINNASDTAYAGAITAALFLQEFVSPATPWVHFDIFAWNPTARPGRPEGGEAMAIRALYRMIAHRHPL
ncbi:leucyl aminopeptidase family protein [Telmatospirillum sp.]|uniref:leucyl aminopeptidase family protein n=1 Tax=Telmatospirillum sp. TaxID=2079197 RepID=UPI00283B5CB7|nr:leucyl aminopeptidase family protein [Telmatospirillum sp.]MDR3438559.1 leucyl aminopeptidase family protein [Telmatospirillum sp.]